MKRQSGFIPVFLLVFAALAVTSTIAGYTIFSKKSDEEKIKFVQITPAPTVSPIPTAVPVRKVFIPLPTKSLPTLASNTATINAIISANNAPLNDDSLNFYLRNEKTGEEKILKNTSSAWTINHVPPGKYKLYVPFSYKKYTYGDRSCEGCQNKQDITDFGICGYVINLNEGDNVKFHCALLPVHQLDLPSNNSNSNNSGPDTSPPTTNIFYPQPNGSITYKTDGKICAYMSEPSDNFGGKNVETFFKFDNGNFSKGVGYLCADSLPNGPHTLSYYSKDQAGNTEATKTISFTVNIPGN